MIDAQATSDAAIATSVAAAQDPRPAETETFQQELVEWLARIRLLQGTPFSYVVPHATMLPQESVRFFYLNRDWTDAATDGALSVGAGTTRDHAYLESVHAELVAAIDVAERQLWSQRVGVELEAGAAEVVTGMLVRSRAVSGWPGMSVRAHRTVDGTQQPVRLLRVERLAPAVLLVLFDGVPARVELEEPRAGAQFGVDTKTGSPAKRTVTIRHPDTGAEGAVVDVPFRAGSPGVLDVIALRQALLAKGPNELGTELSAAELGLQLLQYPTRQPFTDTGSAPDVLQVDSELLAVIEASQGGT